MAVLRDSGSQEGGFEDWFLDAILWSQLQVKNAVKSATPASDPLGAELADLAHTAEPKPVPADWANIFCKHSRFARIVGSRGQDFLDLCLIKGRNGLQTGALWPNPDQV